MPDRVEPTTATTDFDDDLAALAAAAGGAAHMRTPDAIRKRGSRRTIGRTTGGVLVTAAILGALGFGAARLGHAASAGPVAAGPAPTTSASPSPAATAGATASPTPDQSTGTPGTAPATTAPTALVGDPDTFVADAWLPADQEPFVHHGPFGQWQLTVSRNTIGTDIGGAFRLDRMPQWIYSCGTHTWSELGVEKVQLNGYGSTASGAPQASQDLFFFKDRSAARGAYEVMSAEYQSCAEHEKGRTDITAGGPVTTKVTRTAWLKDGAAWLHTARNSQGGPADEPNTFPDSHEFFVQRGNVIAFVGLFGGHSGSSAALDDVTGDQQILQQMADHLSVYGDA